MVYESVSTLFKKKLQLQIKITVLITEVVDFQRNTLLLNVTLTSRVEHVITEQANEFQVYVTRWLSALLLCGYKVTDAKWLLAITWRKEKKSSLFHFLPVYKRSTSLNCNIACIRNRGMGTTAITGVPRPHSLGL